MSYKILFYLNISIALFASFSNSADLKIKKEIPGSWQEELNKVTIYDYSKSKLYICIYRESLHKPILSVEMFRISPLKCDVNRNVYSYIIDPKYNAKLMIYKDNSVNSFFISKFVKKIIITKEGYFTDLHEDFNTVFHAYDLNNFSLYD